MLSRDVPSHSTKTTECREKLARWYAKKKVILVEERSSAAQAAEHVAQVAMLDVSAVHELAMAEETVTLLAHDQLQPQEQAAEGPQHDAVLQNEEFVAVYDGVTLNV